MPRQLDQRARDLHFDSQVFFAESARAKDEGDEVRCELIAEKYLERMRRYWDHLAGLRR